MKTIAFFDFDGTLTRRDTLLDFTRYAVGNLRFAIGLACLIPSIILYYLKIKNRGTIARQFMRHFYKGRSIRCLEQKARVYVSGPIEKIMVPDTYEAFCRHRENNDTIVVVSASPGIWLTPWCKGHNADLIATRMKTYNFTFTGEIEGRRCIGSEKVTRIKQKYDLSSYDTVFAYGNSHGDVAMLKMADHAYFVKGTTLERYDSNCHP